jgi:photosystem II stability/assembly factor-like uncharacterized protein
MRNLVNGNRNRVQLGVNLTLLLTLLVCLGLLAPAFPRFPRKVRSVAAKLVAKLPFRRKPPQAKPALAQRRNYAEESKENRFDHPDEAAEHFRRKRLPAGETELPFDKYLAAREQINEMQQYATAENRFLPARNELAQQAELVASPEVLGAWTTLGPGNVGGRTRALIIHPTTPTTMYAAGVAGGVWKTTNSGSAWTPLTDLIANLAVCSLAMDPANPNIIYAGTGEPYAGDGVRGAGIFKTTDGGMSWSHLANTNNSNFHFVNKLVASNGQRVYAANSTGLWRSIDGGANWTQVLNQPSCNDLLRRTDQGTDYLFATCRPGSQGTIYRNTDAAGAGVWTSVFTEAGMARTSLALAPSNQGTIYALSASSLGGPGNHYFGGLHALFRSTSSGDSGTWTARVRNTDAIRLNTLLLTYPQGATAQQCGLGSDFYSNQGGYDNVIAVDPLDANRVWAGGIALFRSDDGGANWGIASCYPHPDVHAIVFHPQFNGTSNKTMYIGNDGGVEKTDDARALVKTNACDNTCDSYATFTHLNNGYGVTQFYHGLPYPDGATYFGGTQDNGTQRGSDGSGVNGWNFILGGDGGYVAIDPANTNVLYAATTGFPSGIRKTTNGSNASPSWVSAQNGITESLSFFTPFTMDPSNSQRLWTGGSQLWRTDNGAANWSQASTTLANDMSAIAVAPTDSNYVLAGTAAGHIHRTTAGTSATSGTVWPNVQPRTGYVSWVSFDPTDKNIAYATYSTFGGTHVWKSTNAGASWTGLDGMAPNNLPDIPVHCILVDPTNTSRLYVGTDLGVFSSTDGGANWAVENTGFANVITESLAINSGATKYLFAFTHGRGVWRVSLSGGGGNTAPTISDITNQTINQNSNTGALAFTVGDAETPAASLMLSGSSSNTTLVPNANIVFGGSGANRTVTVTPAANQTGTATITVTVTDGGGMTATDTFLLTVNSCGASLSKTAQNFAATGGTGSFTVTIAGGCQWTAVSNNPSFITVTAPAGTATGTGTVSFTVSGHTNTTSRNGSITVAGQTFTVRQGAQFLDVPVGTAFYEEIGKLSAAGVTQGCGGGNYCYSGNVTREQMAIFIERALGVFTPPAGPATPTFQDVPNSGATDVSHEFIEDFVARGITQGCAVGPPRLYCPTANVTREQMAIFIERALGVFTPPAGPATPTFQDVPNSGATNFSYEFIEDFVARGITSGCAAGPPRLFCPAAAVTRAQMAVFLVRAFGL